MLPPVDADKGTWELEWDDARRFREYCALVEAHNRLRKQQSELELRYEEMKQLVVELREKVAQGEKARRRLFDRLEAIRTLAAPKEE